MDRKNRKWVAMAVALYLFVVWSAYRWGVAQLPADGNIFEHIEREAKRKNAEEAAKAAAAQPNPTGESRLTAAGPAYVAARYDATHVVCMVAAETESRFAARPQSGATPAKLLAPANEATGALGDSLDFQTILNEFDADHDGWAELLIHSDQGDSTAISLYPYTDRGLVPMKTALRRDSQSPSRA